jgi:quinol monooxygenase YgiN
MKAVKVEYTVKPKYVDQNKANIAKVMAAIKSNPIEGLYYSSFTDKDNPNTFIHINMAKDDETMSKLNGVEEFTAFRIALKGSQPISPPKQTTLNLVAAGFDM